jgi:hypothetical protein
VTQSGRGEEPSARPAHEGIVLPSDGGEPLLPGQAGGAGGSTVPAGDRGPALPSGESDGHAAPAGGQAWGQPWGPGHDTNAPAPAQTWGSGVTQHWDAQSGWNEAPAPPQQPPAAPQQPPAAPQQPPAAPGQPLPPEAPQHGAPSLPPTTGPADEGATQYIPPVGAASDEGATQYMPPVAAAPDEGATQYIPPVAPGALPPEMPVDQATQVLGRAAAAPLPPAADPDAQSTQYLPPVTGQPDPSPYAVRPGAPGQAPPAAPPAEFDNLFRNDAGAAPATQHVPQFGDGPAAPEGHAAGQRGGGGRGRSRIPVIAAVGIGIAVLGIGAGALLSGGGGDGKSGDSKSVAATGAAPDASESGADPARAQAVGLDRLLADSGNSRGTVIKAVADVKACQNLDQAATDLRGAAKQRNDMVGRLSGIAVDKLPRHDQLTAALTGAWQASASADTHYAAWAGQVSGDKHCKKGHARSTGQASAGNQASGMATAQKVKAAQLWNLIAQKYGLTQRQPTQL